jgi:hypothetical protein
MNSNKEVFKNNGRKLDDKIIEKPKPTGNKFEDEISLAIYNSLLEEKQKNSNLSKEEIRKKRICYFLENC